MNVGHHDLGKLKLGGKDAAKTDYDHLTFVFVHTPTVPILLICMQRLLTMLLTIVQIGHLSLTGTSMPRMRGDVVGKERRRIHNEQSSTVETNLGAILISEIQLRLI